MTRLEEIKNLLEETPRLDHFNNIEISAPDLAYLISRVEKLETALRFYASGDVQIKAEVYCTGASNPNEVEVRCWFTKEYLEIARTTLSDSDEEIKNGK